jgi:hypothetical protein
MKKKRKEETETMDIYKDEQREQMLKGDEITAAESALMAGRDRKIGKKKKDLWLEKKEAKPVELAQEEHQED